MHQFELGTRMFLLYKTSLLLSGKVPRIPSGHDLPSIVFASQLFSQNSYQAKKPKENLPPSQWFRYSFPRSLPSRLQVHHQYNPLKPFSRQKGHPDHSQSITSGVRIEDNESIKPFSLKPWIKLIGRFCDIELMETWLIGKVPTPSFYHGSQISYEDDSHLSIRSPFTNFGTNFPYALIRLPNQSPYPKQKGLRVCQFARNRSSGT